MTINLTKTHIDAVLPKVAKGLQQYVWLQAKRDAGDLRSDLLFRRQFNHFYRVRRKKEWQDTFYELLESFKGAAVGFPDVFDALYRATGRYEASFASKLLATLNPDMPVIDSIVLGNLKLRLPAAHRHAARSPRPAAPGGRARPSNPRGKSPHRSRFPTSPAAPNESRRYRWSRTPPT